MKIRKAMTVKRINNVELIFFIITNACVLFLFIGGRISLELPNSVTLILKITGILSATLFGVIFLVQEHKKQVAEVAAEQLLERDIKSEEK